MHNASADAARPVLEDRRESHDGIMANCPGWKSEMWLKLDKDELGNSRDFSEALAVMSGTLVSAVPPLWLCRICQVTHRRTKATPAYRCITRDTMLHMRNVLPPARALRKAGRRQHRRSGRISSKMRIQHAQVGVHYVRSVSVGLRG